MLERQETSAPLSSPHSEHESVLPTHWWLLEGTGFNVRTQTKKLISSFKEGMAQGKEKSLVVRSWIKQTVQDILGYNLEYLQEGLVFPILVGLQEQDGRRRLVGTEYGNQPLAETILPEERNGAVKDSVEKIEAFMAGAKPGETAIMVSPPGHSGLKTDSGAPIIFPDTQVYFFEKGERNEVKGTTLRLSLSLEKCEDLLKSLGIPQALLGRGETRERRTEQVVRNIVLRKGEDYKITVQDLITELERARGEKTAYKGKSFDKMRQDAENPEKLLEMDKETNAIVSEFISFAGENLGDLSLDKIHMMERVLGETLLRLTLLIRNGQNFSPRALRNFGDDLIPLEYMQALTVMRSLPGCNGGGGIATAIPGVGGARLGIALDSKLKETWGYHNDDCVDCGAKKEDDTMVGPCGICTNCEKKY